ncbi:MAG TPA: isoprenyl transferase [Thermodesulfobacteriota bacterium]|nr:isoprenyl transferase [Thermodesulfobacteriota bacterium]
MKSFTPDKLPRHIAIIMDGNGRWAQKRALPRVAGHKEGVESVREVIRGCRELGISVLTLYAFSRENWNRPKWEVKALMQLLSKYLKSELKELQQNGIALRIIGDLEQLPEKLQVNLKKAMEQTRNNSQMILNVALSYSGRAEILMALRKAAEAVKQGTLRIEELTEETFEGFLYTKGLPDPDLLIRTSGEYRLSDFLIYQSAYAEIYVTNVLWPDFRKKHLLQAIQEFQKRERRFGLTGEQVRQKNLPDSNLF